MISAITRYTNLNLERELLVCNILGLRFWGSGFGRGPVGMEHKCCLLGKKATKIGRH